MGKTILFSAVGGTDPISLNNLHDGSLLHICRWYKPDEVYLYMSKEMLEFQNQDDRYRYCINKLAESQNREIVIHEIERPELVNVQDFNYFYDDFKECLSEIIRNAGDAEILVNISSGTPAIKSGLLVLITLGELYCKTVQVITPTKSLNEHSHKEYDVEMLWELNEDNLPDSENRCKIVYCPSLSNIKQTEIIKQLVREYDYKAALSAAELLPEEATKSYLALLKIACARLQLDNRDLNAQVNQYQMSGFPVKGDDARKYFEYALALDIKRRRGEYGDFVRALSPILADLFEMVLYKECGINIRKYVEVKNRVPRWSPSLLCGTEVESILISSFSSFDYKAVSSIHILKIIENKCHNEKVINIVESLRQVEQEVRNIAAHEVVSVTEKMIKDTTGYSSQQVMNLVKEAFKYTNLNIRSEYWDAYDDMNDFIISRI
ncbi:type III-A CRISPR-associated CARF protein Csm6 [[Clostridium] aminophilum]|uniref:CRISPR type III-A/MTUBE-associated protein Csm6 n=1 Tax=[Clostridium] aminophilum TaxID=1526 RepID=A0A1I6JKM2_9FIRM|nr:hypothetical protein [[Clostridium] aminophilum]SFR79457.1 CRISPR type III-A/MTUBE-associated protein Csm6 [[Clostridium] aminophilum]